MTQRRPKSVEAATTIAVAPSTRRTGGYGSATDALNRPHEASESNETVNVLLIDDSEAEFVLCFEILAEARDHPFRLTWQPDPELALEAMTANQHDLYLLDYRLGHRNGLEVLQQAIAGGCSKPIILMTGFGSRELDKEPIRLGAADYLPKNHLTSALLESALRHAVERAKLQANLIENEWRFRAMFENAFQQILLLESDGTIVDANPTALEAKSLTLEDVVGKKLWKLY